jgi:hypothetical protein
MSGDRTIPFRWILPIAELLICQALLWPSLRYIAYNVQMSWNSYRPQTGPRQAADSKPVFVMPSPLNLDAAIERRVHIIERMEPVPAALNIPAGLIQLPYVILNPEKTEWVPRGMDFMIWRSLSWPIIGIVFWWIAGRGVEALVAACHRVVRPRIGWPETILGIIFFVGGTAIAAGVLGGPSGPGDNGRMVFFGIGLALWAILGAITVTARILQWRIRQQSRDASGAALRPS